MASGQGALLVVSGGAGIGKSALMSEICRGAVHRGYGVGVGKAEESDQIASMAPLLLAKSTDSAAGAASRTSKKPTSQWSRQQVPSFLSGREDPKRHCGCRPTSCARGGQGGLLACGYRPIHRHRVR